MSIINKITNYIIMQFLCVKRILVKDSGKTVFLTFDDGPEPGITEFVLSELDKYGFKATFFCTGKAAVANKDLIAAIKASGHSIGNHSYSHIMAYDIDGLSYINDVNNAYKVLNTPIFRPPNGCLTLKTWWALRRFKIIYWTIGSNDWCNGKEKFNQGLNRLEKTKSGDIILFHFCNNLANGTKQILPKYLEWLSNRGFKSEAIH